MKSSNILLFDGDFIPFYACMGNKVFENGEPVKVDGKFVYTDRILEEVYECVDSIINNILKIGNTDKYIGFLGGSKCFRYDIYPEYKANRKNLVKPRFWQECKNYLIKKWKFEICDKIEADDAVNITRNLLKNKYDCIIVTTDKDLIKCIEGNYINARDCSIIWTDSIEADYNFWMSMITGDSIDNIKGIPKRGKVYADKILFVCKNRSQAVYDTYYINNCLDYDLNYTLLKILDEYEGFVLPEIQSVGKEIDIAGCDSNKDDL